MEAMSWYSILAASSLCDLSSFPPSLAIGIKGFSCSVSFPNLKHNTRTLLQLRDNLFYLVTARIELWESKCLWNHRASASGTIIARESCSGHADN
jgi:hypothetical protein